MMESASALAKLTRVAPEIPAADVKRAVDFYAQLGFAKVFEIPGEYAIVERDGIALHLFRAEPGQSPAGVHIFTPDLEELFAEFETGGVEFAQRVERKPWGNREFRVRDEFGNVLKFTEPVGE